MPGIIVVAITTFIGAYAQQFIFALTFNSKTEFMPLPVGLFAFFGKQEVVWNELMAARFVGIAPALDRHLLPAALPRRRADRRRRETMNQPRGRRKLTQPIRSLVGAAALLASTALPGLAAGPGDLLDLLRRHARPGAREVHRRVGGRQRRAGRWRPKLVGWAPVPGQGDDARRRRHARSRSPMSARAR